MMAIYTNFPLYTHPPTTPLLVTPVYYSDSAGSESLPAEISLTTGAIICGAHACALSSLTALSDKIMDIGICYIYT